MVPKRWNQCDIPKAVYFKYNPSESCFWGDFISLLLQACLQPVSSKEPPNYQLVS